VHVIILFVRFVFRRTLHTYTLHSPYQIKSNQIKFISGDKAHSTNTDDHKTHTHTHTHRNM